MKIALVGAFDRNNYGDIMMPVVLEERLLDKYKCQKIEFDFFGLCQSNMEYVKGHNTRPLHELYESKEYYDAIIIVGGEVLTSRYTNMYLNLQTNELVIRLYIFLSKVFPVIVENICKQKLKGKDKYPWILDKDKLNCKYLIYNTVGGKTISTEKKICNIIKKIDYISLRDKKTYDAVVNINKNSKLYPDSVVSLSEVIKEQSLEENISNDIKESLCNMGDYFVIQVKKKIGKKIWKELIKQIEEIYRFLNISCVLLPIGYAQGHEDQVILEKMYKKIKTKKLLIKNNNIYDTAYTIKNSKAYIGTSLHGAITAISYKVPHMALTNQIQKQVDFLTTWKSTPIISSSPNSLCNNLEELLKNHETYKMLENSKKKLLLESNKNFQSICKVLEGIKK